MEETPPSSCEGEKRREEEDEGGDGEAEAEAEAQYSKDKTQRLPRWTRQEIIVLIQGKGLVESWHAARRKSNGHDNKSPFEPAIQMESKWCAISSYCKKHGVNREAVQCRKRWSNLSSDFRKIKDWESSRIHQDNNININLENNINMNISSSDASGSSPSDVSPRPISSCPPKQSFWDMRNDVRRDHKLPGFFDREVYDILLSYVGSNTTTTTTHEVFICNEDVRVNNKSGFAGEPLFDGGSKLGDDVVAVSDFEQSGDEDLFHDKDSPSHPSNTTAFPFHFPGSRSDKLPSQVNEKASASCATGQKRKRTSTNGESDTEFKDQLIGVLERNSRVLSAHMEAQNMNSQLDRNQRRDHAESFVAVLGKLADAIGRIADKL